MDNFGSNVSPTMAVINLEKLRNKNSDACLPDDLNGMSIVS
jgi:hypothetical protein